MTNVTTREVLHPRAGTFKVGNNRSGMPLARRTGTQGGKPAYHAGGWNTTPEDPNVSPLLTDNVKQRICDSLREGLSIFRCARVFGVGVATVSKIAADNKIDVCELHAQRAQQARRDYCQAERLRVINLAFERVEELLDEVETPRDLKDTTVAMAICIDKRRLEDGETTQNVGVTNEVETARSAVRNKLLEMAEKRRGLAPGSLQLAPAPPVRQVASVEVSAAVEGEYHEVSESTLHTNGAIDTAAD
jgi:hypothetical protein